MAPPGRRTKSVAPKSKPFGMAASKGSMPTPGISAASPATRKEITRQQFFKGRPDVSDDRLVRRQTQADELRAFKQGLTIAPGTTNLYQEQAPTFNPMTGRYERTTLADKAQELAFKYGPTPKEILGDIGYGIRSIGAGLGERISQGRIGIFGIAKDLFEQFTNKASQAKDFLGKQVNKLSDIDLEILKNKDKYKLTSQKPDIQLVNQLESNAKQAAENRDLFGSYSTFGGPSMPGTMTQETLDSIVPSNVYGLPQQPPGFKVMSPEQKQLLSEINASSVGATSTYDPNKDYLQQQDDYYYQDKERFSPQGNQYLYADASQQDIDRINKMRQLKSMDPQSIYDMRDVFQLSPELTLEDIQGIKEGTITQPTGIFAAEGGMIDKKLDNLQKKTNNIYGTGILSVR